MNRTMILLAAIMLSITSPWVASNTVEAASSDNETTVAAMAKISACWSPSFSPDGKQIAFVSDLSGVPQVWIVASEGGWPMAVTALDDQVGSVTWSPDGAWLAFSVAPGGGMNRQVYVVRPDGSDMRRLTDGGTENNWLGDWTHDSRSLRIASNRRTPAAMDAYLVDVAKSKLQLKAQNPGIGSLTSTSRNNDRAVLYRMNNRSDNDLFLLDLTTGDEALLTPHTGPGSFYGVLTPDGRTVYLSSNKDRDLSAFARVRLSEGGQPGPLEILAARKDAELGSFELNKQGTEAALVWNVAGRSELWFIDLVTAKITKGPELPAEIAGALVYSEDGRLLTMTVSGAASPSDVWVLNKKTSRFSQITRSPHAGIDLTKMIRPKLVRFRAHDGLELTGWLYRPPGASGPGPLVLSFHGGPEGQERPRFRSTYQALLSQGIAVFAPNVRGSSGFGKRFVNMDNGQLRFDAVRDIKACIDHVVETGIANPKRIGIMGGSYGGYMVMAGLTEYPDLIAAGANLFGIVNFQTFFEHTEPWMASISKIEYGDPDTEEELLRRLSPIHKLSQVTSPTIVLHGANDTNVPVIEAEQVVEHLKKRGVPVEYVLFPDEGHGFRKTKNRIRSTVSIVRWFSKHLRNRSGRFDEHDVRAGCATCIFNMKGVMGCKLAVEIDGKHYLVKGSSINDHGDAHADDGLCNAARKAIVSGKVEEGMFLAEHIKLLPE